MSGGPNPRRRALLAGLGIALVALLLLAGTWVTLRTLYGIGPIARGFEREAWLAPERRPGERAARRERMVRNLVKRHLRAGMTRAEVEALVGPPDPDPLLSAGASGDWIYMLGATFLGRLRILRWALSEDDELESPDGFESASQAFEIRALRLGFDDEQRLARIEIVSM